MNPDPNKENAPLAEEARGVVGDLYNKASGAAQEGTRYVTDRPWPAIGIAFAAGVVVGLIAGRHEEESAIQTLAAEVPKKLGAGGLLTGAGHFFKHAKLW